MTSVLPLRADVDVLVVGGGPAGVGAALAAARNGASVLIIEQFNCLGGVAGAGGHGHISIYGAWGDRLRVAGGVIYEVARRLVEEDAGWMNHHGVWFEAEKLKFLLDRMMREAGVNILYYTFFCETVVEDGAVTGAVIQNKDGRGLVRAKRIIDCTGDGDVAASAGAPFEQGRPGDGKCQPMTLMFTIGGVDWPRVEAWRTDYQMREVWECAQHNGDMEPFQTTIMGFWWTPTRPDQVGINFTHITNVDSTRAGDLTAATIEGRRQAFQAIDVFRKYVPGMEDCYMVATPNTVGIRESRRIIGPVVLTEEDMKARRTWEDSIGYGAFFIDIHHIDGPGMDETVWHPQPGFRYQIPYRILLPQSVENLLVAGRCVSVTHIALGSIRVMVQCALTGEAAGVAATLSLRDGVSPARRDPDRR
ncbi:MAG: 3-ketosteroid-delta-1-dehydrogenase [bacterium ADurb.Bin429]|nr:MAG: 3-ketosteroid-delta-1-dehydrogenase [bacterium ADurb.Bin429]